MKHYKSILGTRIESITISPNHIAILTKLNGNNSLKLIKELAIHDTRLARKGNNHFIIIPKAEFEKLIQLGKVL